jgi:AcrR family transcriptional regulator
MHIHLYSSQEKKRMPRKKTLPDAEVLAAAGRVLADLGPRRFTLADVAQEAGLSAATLVQRFGSKRALLLAFAAHAADQARQPFDECAETAEPLLALRRALLLASRATTDRRELAHSVAFLLEDLSDDELRAHAARHALSTESSIRELLDLAVRLGQLRANDTARLARALQAAWNGAWIQWGIRGRGSLTGWIAAVIDTVLDPYLTVAAPAGGAS